MAQSPFEFTEPLGRKTLGFAPGLPLSLGAGSLAQSPLSSRSLGEANFYRLTAFDPASKNSFWAHWKTALLGQILARSLLEVTFCHLRAFGPASKIPFWDHWKTALLGQILARSLLGVNFCHVRALGWLLKSPSRIIGKPRFGPNPGQEPFRSKFLPFQGP